MVSKLNATRLTLEEFVKTILVRHSKPSLHCKKLVYQTINKPILDLHNYWGCVAISKPAIIHTKTSNKIIRLMTTENRRDGNSVTTIHTKILNWSGWMKSLPNLHPYYYICQCRKHRSKAQQLLHISVFKCRD